VCFFVLWEGLVHSQILPIWSTSSSIYVGGGQASLTSNIGNFPVTFPTGFTISTLPHRKPFLGICSMQHFTIRNYQAMYFLTRVLDNFTNTGFTLQLENQIVTVAGVVT
jgi:hypothetical protein